MKKTKNEVSAYLNNILLLLLGLFCITFPVAFSTLTTDPFTLPKQIILGVVALVSLVLLGAKMISDGKVVLRRTPLDIAVALFTIVLFISAVISINRADALIAFVPLLFAVILYFIIINTIRNLKSLYFILSSLAIGGIILSIVNVLSFFKIYVLPFAFTKNQLFTPTGFLLDQLLYVVFILPALLFYTWPMIKKYTGQESTRDPETKKSMSQMMFFGVAAIIITLSLCVTLYQLIVVQKPTLLPYGVGFQTAFAAISQDASRTAQGFLFGSGYGTYNTDFTRFKQQSFNANTNLWSFTFFRSSSYVLELLATAGVLGLGAFFLILFGVFKSIGLAPLKKNPFFLGFVIATISAFLLPFGFVLQTLFFIVLALLLTDEGIKQNNKFYDLEFNFVALKKGVITTAAMQWNPTTGTYTPAGPVTEKSFSIFMPITFFIFCLILAGYLGYQMIMYVSSDIVFQHSLNAAAANNGLQTYNDQTNAINLFPSRDVYYRVYSQTNLALANSIASSQPKDATPTAQVQQTISTLIQQSINSARSATAISPLTSLNWQNLSSIYRNLIGFGQNAEQFSLLANQQATVLDPTNPNLYINQGGVYYQLGKWDDAIRQFQISINLKPDLANAYYNLGHALEQKGDLENALIQYQTVKTLVVADPVNTKGINQEIAALEKKIKGGEQVADTSTSKVEPSTDEKLEISTPSAQLPERDQKVKIPAPSVSPAASPTVSPTAKP